jgi:hypothetical protein
VSAIGRECVKTQKLNQPREFPICSRLWQRLRAD